MEFRSIWNCIKKIGAVTLAVVSFVTAVTVYFYKFAFVRKKQKPGVEKEVEEHWKPYMEQIGKEKLWYQEQEKEKISIQSFDGLTLRGDFLKCENPGGTILCVNGYRSEGKADFAGILRFYHENHYNVVLIDQRACGASDGTVMTFGVKERFDVLKWTWYIHDQISDTLPIYLNGISLGAATVMMATELRLPENVKAVVADCGYTSPWDIISLKAKQWFHILPFPVLYQVDCVCRILGKFGIRDASAKEALSHNHNLPVLFVHGEADKFVPLEMSLENYKACAAPKELKIIPGAQHAMSYLVGKEECEKTLLEFFEKFK